VVREPIFLLLIACGVVYLLLGDAPEALMLLGLVFVVMALTLFQERKAERALEALGDLSGPRALVIRGAEQKSIPGRELVRGDVIALSEGDRVLADAVVVSGSKTEGCVAFRCPARAPRAADDDVVPADLFDG
jgi:Ca2+-transporting ATPase